MWMPNDRRWLIPFSLFFTLVVGLLFFLQVSGTEQVPKPRSWEHPKALYVCEAPAWVVDNIDEAVAFIKPWSQYTAVVKAEGPCSALADVSVSCTYEDRETTCVQGSVLVTLADQKFDPNHGDETLWATHLETGVLKRVTILFPSVVEPPISMPLAPTVDLDVDSVDLPENVELLVLIHSLLHAEGYEHVFTDLPGPFTAEPTGHILATSVLKLGYSTKGL